MGYYISVQSLPHNFTAKMMMIIVLLALTDFEENPQKPKSQSSSKVLKSSRTSTLVLGLKGGSA